MKTFLVPALVLMGICTLLNSTGRADDRAVKKDKHETAAAAAKRPAKRRAKQIAVELWIVTLGKSGQKAVGDDELRRLVARATNSNT